MRKPVNVVFDEAHSEAWTIRPEVAEALQAAHPEDSSYARAADALRARDFTVEAHVDGPLTTAALEGADVLVLAHPSEPRWERVVPGGAPVLSSDELDAIEAFVAAGGGLLVLGEEEQDKYGNNLNALLARFGLRLENAMVSDYERHRHAPSWILADLDRAAATDGADLLAGVDEALDRVDLAGREQRRAAIDGGLPFRVGGVSDDEHGRRGEGRVVERARGVRGDLELAARQRSGRLRKRRIGGMGGLDRGGDFRPHGPGFGVRLVEEDAG